MDAYDMAEAIAFELNKDTWSATCIGVGEIQLTNEYGDKFTVTVTEDER